MDSSSVSLNTLSISLFQATVVVSAKQCSRRAMRPAHVLLLISSGLASISRVADRLIRLFASARNLVEARQVFSKVLRPTIYTWHAIISAHAELGASGEALALYVRMQDEGILPNKFIYLCVLKACTLMKDACGGRKVHDDIVRSGFEYDLAVKNTMVDMYSKCGSLDEAYRIFERLHEKDIASWGAMIAGFAAHGLGIEALELFKSMQESGLVPNAVTFLCALRACSCIEALEEGMFLHDQINRLALQSDEVVGSALIDMYAKCRNLQGAVNVFKRLPHQDVVSWSAMISGYAEQGQGGAALTVYQEMQSEGIEPSKVTFLSALKACVVMEDLFQGKLIHTQIIMHNHGPDMAVGNALVDMYAKCGSLEEAQKVFDDMPAKDGISWNAIIQGYVEHNLGIPALDLYSKMRREAFTANKVTFPIILRGCSITKAIVEGRQIHHDIIRRRFELDLAVESALVDMYAKCGAMEEACKVFCTMRKKDVVSWGTILGGHAQLGDWGSARQSFINMQRQGCQPDGWIFSSILSACSHAGEVEEGRWYFTSMIHDHAIKPAADHFNCMIDLLGRAGRLEEARDIVQSVPVELDVNGWTSLLTSCRMYGNKKLGNQCFHESTQLESSNASGFILMSNILAESQMMPDVCGVGGV